jgi:AcrR family transcriptional regulator
MNQIRPQTRDAILEAAFQVLGKNPRASLADIAARAGVGRATLHRHFKGREDLMAALARTAMRELDEAVAAATQDATSYSQALRLSMESIVPLADRQWFLSAEPIDCDDETGANHMRQQRELAEAIEAAKQEGLFDPAVPTSWIVETFDALLYAAWQNVRSGEATPAQAAALAWRTLTTGLGVNKRDE